MPLHNGRPILALHASFVVRLRLPLPVHHSFIFVIRLMKSYGNVSRLFLGNRKHFEAHSVNLVLQVCGEAHLRNCDEVHRLIYLRCLKGTYRLQLRSAKTRSRLDVQRPKGAHRMHLSGGGFRSVDIKETRGGANAENTCGKIGHGKCSSFNEQLR